MDRSDVGHLAHSTIQQLLAFLAYVHKIMHTTTYGDVVFLRYETTTQQLRCVDVAVRQSNKCVGHHSAMSDNEQPLCGNAILVIVYLVDCRMLTPSLRPQQGTPCQAEIVQPTRTYSM